MTQGEPQEPQRPSYERRRRHEKDEKHEKQEEKDEKSRNEKDWDEKWRRDPINALSWALVFIWAGLGFLADTTGWGSKTFPDWWITWAVIMAGAGAIFILFALVRLLIPEHRRPITGNLVIGFIFLGIGLGELTDWGWGVIGAVVFIGVGLIILLGGVFRKRK